MASIVWGQHGEVGGERGEVGEVGIDKNDLISVFESFLSN
jgi:hypothetical protein